MKNKTNIRSFLLIFLSLFLITSSFSQKTKKSKVRLKVEYVKIMNGERYFDIKAGARVKKKNIKVGDINLTIYYKLNGEKVKIGNTRTNLKGESRFLLKDSIEIIPDSTNTYNFLISFKGNDFYKKANKKVHFKNAIIRAQIIKKDSTNFIIATLINSSSNTPVIEESLDVQVQRLFKPLKIGEEFNITDNTGSIMVAIEEGIPGIDGNLTFEVVLNDNDDYGTIINRINAPIGKPIINESTFNERTMWSPKEKTPLFLLIFPNILIFGVWGIIVYLIINLIKITKNHEIT